MMGTTMRAPIQHLGLVLPIFFAVCLQEAAAEEAAIRLAAAQGTVETRDGASESYRRIKAGEVIASGARLRTGADSSATLRFADGTESRLRANTEISVRARDEDRSSIALFFGRLWSKVVKRTGGGSSYEVRSANAAAGVRGTEFEVGVALDGSTRVIVKEGEVAVGDGEARPKPALGGQMVEASGRGRLGKVERAPENPDWDGWFSARAKEMEARGLEVAKSLSGRLNKRKSQLERLVGQQRSLRAEIVALEKQKKQGKDVGRRLERKLEELERVTMRLDSMQQRLQGAFALFERWGGAAKGGRLAEGDAISKLALDVQKIAADFADMIEEGTDLSIEGMDEMMDDMKNGKGMEPGDSAADELFR